MKIDGDNNLKVLKALRSSFCAYEDKCHQIGSYVNLDDWVEKYINKGNIYSIEQSDVDLLQHLINAVCDNTKKKFDKKYVEFFAVSNKKWWSLDKAIKYYEQHDKEGERHQATFVIKNSNVSLRWWQQAGEKEDRDREVEGYSLRNISVWSKNKKIIIFFRIFAKAKSGKKRKVVI